MDEIIISTKTIKEWEQVVKTAQGNGYRWGSGRRGHITENWYEYKENSCIFLLRHDITYGSSGFCGIGDIITAQEYLIKYGSGEKINQPKTIMNKLNLMMKCLLDKDTQLLYKAHYLNGDLELTEKGKQALNTILFLANKEELLKMAKEELEEELGEDK
ncbi:MAG: hypothetical protein U9O91_06445 [Candidatus Caldatribacteriota bacterium]|nr:hypothetical protein [Candidatus Caldatribacteriota bacterium]